MGWLSRYRQRREKKRIKSLPAPARGQALFKYYYPEHEYGIASYGLPEVRDWKEGASLKIGSYCSIADEVKILLGGHHRTDWVTTYPFPAFTSEIADIRDFGGTNGNVIIGSDVWLCSGCMILSGVTIGHGAVIAAGAVVTNNVEPYAIVAGNPAKLIRWRFDEETRQKLLESQWWTWPQSEVVAVSRLLCDANIKPFLEYCRNRKPID